MEKLQLRFKLHSKKASNFQLRGEKTEMVEFSVARVCKIMNSQQHQETKAAKKGERKNQRDIYTSTRD